MDAFWFNAAGLVSGTIGTILIYFYGVPRQIDTGGRGRLLLEGTDDAELSRIRRFKRIGNMGLALIALAFVLQFVGLIVDRLSTG